MFHQFVTNCRTLAIQREQFARFGFRSGMEPQDCYIILRDQPLPFWLHLQKGTDAFHVTLNGPKGYKLSFSGASLPEALNLAREKAMSEQGKWHHIFSGALHLAYDGANVPARNKQRLLPLKISDIHVQTHDEDIKEAL